MTQLDDTDREIRNILRADARTLVSALAQQLRVSRGTVQNRLHKMEESGVIVGYTVWLRPERLRVFGLCPPCTPKHRCTSLQMRAIARAMAVLWLCFAPRSAAF